MLVRSPAEYYVKYLVTHPAGYNNACVQKRLRKYRLSYIGDEYVDDLRLELAEAVPTPFRPKIKGHKPSQQFLLQEGIFGLWHPNEHVQMAWGILDHAQAQEIVEAMVLCGGADEHIVQLLDKRCPELECTREAVARYRHYFWNTRLCSVAELRELCYYQALDGAFGEGKDPSRRAAAKKASYVNARVLAAELPTTPMSTAMVQGMLGFIPAEVDNYKTGRMIYDYTLRRMAEAVLKGGRRAAEEGRDWAIVLREVKEQMNLMVTPEDDLKTMMRGMQLRTEPLQAPLITSLTGGNYSDGSFIETEGEEVKELPPAEKKKKSN